MELGFCLLNGFHVTWVGGGGLLVLEFASSIAQEGLCCAQISKAILEFAHI